MNSFQLLHIAEVKNISVYNFKTRNKKAFCLEDAIVIDFSRVETEREQKQLLSEELGHILSGALYPLFPLRKSALPRKYSKARAQSA